MWSLAKCFRSSGRAYTSGNLILMVAFFVAAFANAKLFAAAINAFGTNAATWPFYISLFVSIAAVLVLLLSAVCHRVIVKPVLIAFLILSATLSYFSSAYGTVFDTQMIANTLATDSAEAGDLLTPKLLLWIGFFGVLPSIAVWRAKLTFPHWKVETIARLKQAGAALGVILVSGIAFGGHYAALLREHRDVTNKMIPAYALLSAIRTAGHAIPAAAQEDHVVLGQDAVLPRSDGHRELVIMVVGETVRADHWGLNGYARDTTPLLRNANVLNFPDFWSCGTSTAISVPCMFSSLGHDYLNQSEVLTPKHHVLCKSTFALEEVFMNRLPERQAPIALTFLSGEGFVDGIKSALLNA